MMKKEVTVKKTTKNADKEWEMPEATFSQPAFSMYQDSVTEKYTVVKIVYDPSLLISDTKVEVIATFTEQAMAAEQLKLCIGRDLL